MYRVLLADEEQIERMALARAQPDHYHGYFHAGIKWCRSGREDPQHG